MLHKWKNSNLKKKYNPYQLLYLTVFNYNIENCSSVMFICTTKLTLKFNYFTYTIFANIQHTKPIVIDFH